MGFPKLGASFLLGGGAHNAEYDVFVSFLGSPYLQKLAERERGRQREIERQREERERERERERARERGRERERERVRKRQTYSCTGAKGAYKTILWSISNIGERCFI